MRIDPVYLIAPLPAAKTMLARRAFLIAGVAGATGLAVGGLAGTMLARPTTIESTDPVLQWLRGLATATTPAATLLDSHGIYLQLLPTRYQDDPQLWSGIERMVRAVLEDNTLVNRRALAKDLADFLTDGPAKAHRPDLLGHIDALRALDHR